MLYLLTKVNCHSLYNNLNSRSSECPWSSECQCYLSVVIASVSVFGVHVLVCQRAIVTVCEGVSVSVSVSEC